MSVPQYCPKCKSRHMTRVKWADHIWKCKHCGQVWEMFENA